MSTAALVLIAIAAWAAYSNFARAGWTSDAAAWVQAAGAIAAIIGAAWLAQGETRRARRARREFGEEAAWHVRFAVRQAQFDSQIIAAELVNRNTAVREDDVRGWRQRATVSALTLDMLIARPEYIHPAVPHVIANAKVLMADLLADLAEAAVVARSGAQPSDELKGRIAGAQSALLELLEEYEARMPGVQIALDEGGDMLPIRPWIRHDID